MTKKTKMAEKKTVMKNKQSILAELKLINEDL
jgi:hypothetical protein